MRKSLALCALITVFSAPLCAQTHTTVTLEENQTVLGNKTFMGNVVATVGQNALGQVHTFNTDFYVGAGITNWSGSDIGAQINSAYAACPSIGCTIWILPNGTSNRYTYVTPIVMDTSGKVASVRGMSSGTDGIQLNYTPTTATTAWTIDYTPSGGDAEAPKEVIRNITLINNGCTTYEGCGSSATGLLIGSSNNGALNGKFTNIRVVGFATDVSVSNAASWGMVFDNCTLGAAGTVAFSTNSLGVEETTLRNCRIVSSTIGISIGSGDLFIDGGSIDQNATGISQTGGQVTTSGVHWEGQSGTGTPLQCWASTGGNAAIYGGTLTDNVTNGSIDNYFAFGGEHFVVSGLMTASSGRTVSTGIVRANASTRGLIFGVQQHSSAPLWGGPNAAYVTSFGGIGTSSNSPAIFQVESPMQAGGTKFRISGCSTSASSGGAWAGSYTSGTTGSCTVTIVPTTVTAAAHGWICDAHDTTTPADVINQTGFTTTTATLSGPTASGDVIVFKCSAF
jgi:hypothetical protein